jgi:DNA invertase Pin-like site-specific DNA recombinase
MSAIEPSAQFFLIVADHDQGFLRLVSAARKVQRTARLKAAAQRRKRFDVVMAWSVDRLGRSLIDLISGLQELHAAKVDLVLHQQDIDTTTPGGKALFQMMGVFAEFERAMITDRIRVGMLKIGRNLKIGTTVVQRTAKEAAA